ncbi:MAG: aminotransferase class V-fold PLP-dependent enzyme [Bacteroidota bacterium]
MQTSERASLTIDDLASSIVGIDQEIPLLDGTKTRYVNLDNAASTPALQQVKETLDTFMPYYSSVHRGTGFKSRLSTIAYDQAHEIIADFVGADHELDTVIFSKNTTESINKLSYRLNFQPDDVVLTSRMEHHSNDLPWRDRCTLVYIDATPEGRLDREDYQKKLELYGDRIKLVTVTGASNVSGFLQPIHWMAEKAHAAGAEILVDVAQMAPHRAVDMKAHDDPQHLDYLVLSAHKMYAPYGTGALIGPKKTFMAKAPEYKGGGTVSLVGENYVKWAGMPDRDEAGSPNVVGAVAMAAAAQTLMDVGMDEVARHEQELLEYAIPKLQAIDGITVYGETDPDKLDEKVGVIPFNVEGVPHFKVAAILGYEGGIGVRSGCFCAQPYVNHLLGQSEEWNQRLDEGITSYENLPGLIRASFGCYNSTDDVDRLVQMLDKIVTNDYLGTYQRQENKTEYLPVDYQEPVNDYFALRPFNDTF